MEGVMKKPFSKLILLATALFLVSGCGGGSSSDNDLGYYLGELARGGFGPYTGTIPPPCDHTMLAGRVTNNSNGIEGVVVTISESVLGGASFTTTTGIDGMYWFYQCQDCRMRTGFYNFPDDYQFSGDYTVTATLGNQSFSPADTNVTIIDGSYLYVDFQIPQMIWFVDIYSPANTPDGLTWDTAFHHPQNGADMAGTGDQVWVAEGIYPRGFTMKEGVEFYGGFAGTETLLSERDLTAHTTILDGEDLGGHIVVGASHALLDGFMVTRGKSAWGSSGAGMFNEDVIGLEVVNSVFASNVAHGNGGGMYNNRAEVIVDNCIFRNNSASANNFSHTGGYGHGGGMYNNRSEVYVDNCIVRNNSAYRNGGGINNSNSNLVFYDTVFDSNTAAKGGGGYFSSGGSADMYNCLLIKNSASAIGGGVMYKNNGGEIVNSTITDNSAGDDGGGYYGWNYSGFILNSIVYGNTPNQIANDLISSPYPAVENYPIVSHSNVQGGYAGTNINADPQFMDAANGDYRLADNSPCIDAGNDEYVPSDITTDLDGYSRFVDGDGFNFAEVDMGAYEYLSQ